MINLDDFNYLVCLDGEADREDTPYLGKNGGMHNAFGAALVLKQAHPERDVTVKILLAEKE